MKSIWKFVICFSLALVITFVNIGGSALAVPLLSSRSVAVLPVLPSHPAFVQFIPILEGIGAAVVESILAAEGTAVAEGALAAVGAAVAEGALVAEGAAVAKGAAVAEGAAVGAAVAEGALIAEGAAVAEGALVAEGFKASVNVAIDTATLRQIVNTSGQLVVGYVAVDIANELLQAYNTYNEVRRKSNYPIDPCKPIIITPKGSDKSFSITDPSTCHS